MGVLAISVLVVVTTRDCDPAKLDRKWAKDERNGLNVLVGGALQLAKPKPDGLAVISPAI